MIKDIPLFAVDVGNTRTKVGFWATPDYEALQRTKELSVPICDDETSDPSPVCDGVIEWLQKSSGISERPSMWLVSSVNKQKTSELEKRVRALRPRDSFVNLALRDVPIQVEYDNPSKLGLDRAIAAYSALYLFKNRTPFLVVDVGTAATIDYVDWRGVFCGGAILPGPKLTVEALNAKTSQLPLLSDADILGASDCFERKGDRVLVYPATDTQRAIRLGVVYSLVGAIMSFFWSVRRRLILNGVNPEVLTLVLAGGDAEMTKDSLLAGFNELGCNLGTTIPTPRIYVEPRLVLNGVFRIAARRVGLRDTGNIDEI